MNFYQGREVLKFCDSYSRLPTLLDIWPHMPPEDWLRLLGEVWSSCDNVGQLFATGMLEECPYLQSDRVITEMMNDTELEAMATLPEDLIVYRGCTSENKWGVSWSINPTVAEQFPFQNRYHHGTQRPLLVKARISKRHITALKLDRNEQEVICLRSSPKHISTRTAIENKQEVYP